MIRSLILFHFILVSLSYLTTHNQNIHSQNIQYIQKHISNQFGQPYKQFLKLISKHTEHHKSQGLNQPYHSKLTYILLYEPAIIYQAVARLDYFHTQFINLVVQRLLDLQKNNYPQPIQFFASAIPKVHLHRTYIQLGNRSPSTRRIYVQNSVRRNHDQEKNQQKAERLRKIHLNQNNANIFGSQQLDQDNFISKDDFTTLSMKQQDQYIEQLEQKQKELKDKILVGVLVKEGQNSNNIGKMQQKQSNMEGNIEILLNKVQKQEEAISELQDKLNQETKIRIEGNGSQLHVENNQNISEFINQNIEQAYKIREQKQISNQIVKVIGQLGFYRFVNVPEFQQLLKNDEANVIDYESLYKFMSNIGSNLIEVIKTQDLGHITKSGQKMYFLVQSDYNHPIQQENEKIEIEYDVDSQKFKMNNYIENSYNKVKKDAFDNIQIKCQIDNSEQSLGQEDIQKYLIMNASNIKKVKLVQQSFYDIQPKIEIVIEKGRMFTFFDLESHVSLLNIIDNKNKQNSIDFDELNYFYQQQMEQQQVTKEVWMQTYANNLDSQKEHAMIINSQLIMQKLKKYWKIISLGQE